MVFLPSRALAVVLSCVASFAVSTQLLAAQDVAPMSRRSPVSTAGKPLIVLIHGRAQEYRVDTLLRAEWIGAVKDGLRKIGGEGLISDQDIELVSYQDAFEPEMPPPDGCSPSELTADRYTRDHRSSTLVRWVLEPRRTSVMLPLRDRLAATLNSPGLVTGALRDVEDYFITNGGIGCAVNRRLRERLTLAQSAGRPIILVAHSLGSLVTYRVLTGAAARDSTIVVSRLVTIGSQLPYRKLLRHFMKDSADAAFPPGVQRWINVVGLGDMAAFEARGLGEFKREPRLSEVHVATDPGDRHSAVAYLKNPVTALAIAGGWCAAYEQSANTQSPCSDTSFTDVTDALTPERYAREPFMAVLLRWLRLEPETWRDTLYDDKYRFAHGFGIAGYVRSLPFIPQEWGVDFRRSDWWTANVTWAPRSILEWTPYLVAGYGHHRWGRGELGHVGSTGLGLRAPVVVGSRVRPTYVGGLNVEYRWTHVFSGTSAVRRPGDGGIRVALVANVGPIVDFVPTLVRGARVSDPCAEEATGLPRNCILAYRLDGRTRRALDLSREAGPDSTMSDTVPASDARIFPGSYSAIEWATPDQALTRIKQAKPDAVVMSLDAAERLARNVLPALRKEARFRELATIVVISSKTKYRTVISRNGKPLKERCASLPVTLCVDVHPDDGIARNAIDEERRRVVLASKRTANR